MSDFDDLESPMSAMGGGGLGGGTPPPPQWIKVMAEVGEDADKIVEVPLEQDNTLLLSTLQSQFGLAMGLKFRHEDTRVMRGVRMTAQQSLTAPEGNWGDRIYVVVMRPTAQAGADRKRKADGDGDEDMMGDGGAAMGLAAGGGLAAAGGRKESRGPHTATATANRRQCYKCGGSGHLAAMCPSIEGSKLNPNLPECHMCHGKGHMRAACPNNIPAGMCYKCRQFGHNGRDCQSPFGGGIGGIGGFAAQPMAMAGFGAPFGAPFGGIRPGRTCYRCGRPDHQAAQCPRLLSGESSSSCFKCGLEGHMAKDCNICFVCKQPGHIASACPQRHFASQ